MEKNFPGSREKSVFASVELSLRRMSQANQDRARVLGVFHGVVDLDMLAMMMQWEKQDVTSLAVELIETGLATPNPYNHLTLNPALCPYLRALMTVEESESLTPRWVEIMRKYTLFLTQQQNQKIEIAATLTVLELPNFFALLDLVQRAGDADATIDQATSLYKLLENAGKRRLLERVGEIRDAAAEALGDTWNHSRFEAAVTGIEQQRSGGRLREAFDDAQQLLRRVRAADEHAYPKADYDLGVACLLLARVLADIGGFEEALPLLAEARQRFETVTKEETDKIPEIMVSVCITEKGDCLLDLGRLDEAAAAYEEAIRRCEQLGDERGVAVIKGQLGTLRMQQRRYREALAAYVEARDRFTKLDEPGSIAVSWHQIGMVCEDIGQPEAAEDAYRKSLAIKVRLADVAGQASTLNQLGQLYFYVLERPEEAARFYRQAADKYVDVGDVAKEGITTDNLARALRKLRRLDEARQAVRRAIECKEQFGHGGRPWSSWGTLADIETAAGNIAAAVQAKSKAIACYLAYRRDGAENHHWEGRISLNVTKFLLASDSAGAASQLEQIAANRDLPNHAQTFIHALQAIMGGSRDRSLADDPDLDYGMAAEILFLIETLEKRSREN
jgi:tetratricopeptide (TPR) repeat protein